jgi:hypothetical protein
VVVGSDITSKLTPSHVNFLVRALESESDAVALACEASEADRMRALGPAAASRIIVRPLRAEDLLRVLRS